MRKMFVFAWLLCCIRCFGGDETPILFNKMLDSYKKESFFSCKGEVGTGMSGSQIRDIKKFELSFVRPDKFNLEFVGNNPANQQPRTNKIFTLFGKVYSQVDPATQPKEEISLYEALKNNSGVSAGVSVFVPFLLLGTNFFSLDGITQKPDTQVDGVKCFHFSAMTVQKQPVEVFVDQQHFVILKLQRTFKVDSKRIPTNAPGLAAMANSEFETTITCHNFELK